MKKLFVLLILFSVSVQAKTIKVAVIDTGFDTKSTWPDAAKYGFRVPKLCTDGHYNFVTNTTDITDSHGHGTHVAGLIAKYAKDADYCLIILKFYDPRYPSNNLENLIKSIKKAIALKVDIINFSGGGTDFSKEERKQVKRALNKGITFISAAGNEAHNIDKHKYYPAMYDDRVIVVENWKFKPLLQMKGSAWAYVVSSSNYSNLGTTDGGELGEDVWSLVPNNSYNTLTGTSQATAIRTGKVVKQLSDAYNINIDLILQRIKRTKNMA